MWRDCVCVILRVRRVVCTTSTTLSQKFKAEISYIENLKCDGDREMNGKYFSNELEIIEAGENAKNIKLLFNSLKTRPFFQLS